MSSISEELFNYTTKQFKMNYVQQNYDRHFLNSEFCHIYCINIRIFFPYLNQLVSRKLPVNLLEEKLPWSWPLWLPENQILPPAVDPHIHMPSTVAINEVTRCLKFSLLLIRKTLFQQLVRDIAQDSRTDPSLPY